MPSPSRAGGPVMAQLARDISIIHAAASSVHGRWLPRNDTMGCAEHAVPGSGIGTVPRPRLLRAASAPLYVLGQSGHGKARRPERRILTRQPVTTRGVRCPTSRRSPSTPDSRQGWPSSGQQSSAFPIDPADRGDRRQDLAADERCSWAQTDGLHVSISPATDSRPPADDGPRCTTQRRARGRQTHREEDGAVREWEEPQAAGRSTPTRRATGSARSRRARWSVIRVAVKV